jgi:putative peptidoglycan lipid II flippase
MHQAAYLLALFALLSQALALVRDRLLAGTFGATHTLDVYYAAFRIPDLLFATVASLLSLYALLPILSRLEPKGKTASFLRGTLLIFFISMGIIAGVLYLLVPVLAPLAAPGLDHERLVLLTRILLLQPILLGASNIIASLTQLRHRFLLYSVSPLLYNVGIILGIIALYPQMGLAGLGWGVVLGALLHLLVQLPFFFGERADTSALREAWKSLPEVLTLSVPRTVTLAAGQIALLILVAMASFLLPGSIAVFTFAFNLQAVPLAIIGVSYSVAAFPTLSRLHAAGESGEFLRHIEAALRHMLFWAIPATVFIIVLRAHLVRAILGVGAFDWGATRLTAAALALFVVSLCAQSIVLLIARAYYAAGKTARPLMFAAVGVGVSVVSAYILLRAFQAHELWRGVLENMLRVSDIAGTPVLMLALGYCLGAVAQAAVALSAFSGEFGLGLKGLRRLAFESFGSSVIGGAVAYGALAVLGGLIDINTTAGIISEATIAGILGLLTTAGILAALGNAELSEAYATLRRRFVSEPPALEATEVA